MPPSEPSQPRQSPLLSQWLAPPFLLSAVLQIASVSGVWTVMQYRQDLTDKVSAAQQVQLQAAQAELGSLKLRVNTLEADGQGRERLWLEKFSSLDSRSQRIESMLEELLRGRATHSASYR